MFYLRGLPTGGRQILQYFLTTVDLRRYAGRKDVEALVELV